MVLKKKRKKVTKKLKTKNGWTRRNGPGDSPWRQSGEEKDLWKR